MTPRRRPAVVGGLPPDLHPAVEDAVDLHDGRAMDMDILLILVDEEPSSEADAAQLIVHGHHQVQGSVPYPDHGPFLNDAAPGPSTTAQAADWHSSRLSVSWPPQRACTPLGDPIDMPRCRRVNVCSRLGGLTKKRSSTRQISPCGFPRPDTRFSAAYEPGC
jgi:hypothetical protein